jgi:ankyrin repeat protein
VSIPVNPEQQPRKQHDIAVFREAVISGDVPLVRQLLASAHVQVLVNAPMFAFGQRPAHVAAKDAGMLEVLLAAGADVNLRSEWENGPYTVLDNANEDTAHFLIARGATLTANVAARLGWFDELQRMIAAHPALVNARGGDGQQPLHEAKTVAIADYLLNHGGDIDARCIDHKSTPAQYALVDRPDVCRRLLERGAMPDIYMAACLGDRALATRILDADPAAVAARINQPGYPPVPPMHIYCWTLGFGMSPHDVALKFGHPDVGELLEARSPASVRFLNAVIAGDEPAARAFVDADASLLSSLTPEVHGHLAQAIFHGRDRAAALMLRLGFDETAPGVDGGTALHAACWAGNVRMVEILLERGRVNVDARDPTHLSTPLGWAAFGSVHRRAPGADYVAVVDRLVAAGADISAPGNVENRSLLAMAEGNGAVQDALRRHGA